MGERAFQLGCTGHIAGQVSLELVVVAGDDLFDQLLVDTMLLVGDVAGQRSRVVLTVRVVFECLIGQHIGDAVQSLFFAERQLERSETVAPLRMERVEYADGSWPVACRPC